jgi:hypothetical protein
LDEQVEDVRQHIGGDAAPVVGHRDFGAAVDLPRRDPDGAARIRVFGGVGEQVRDDLRETTRIGFDEEAGSRHVEAQQMIPFFEERAGHLDRLRDRRSDLDALASQL